jgi:hypothetical protein
VKAFEEMSAMNPWETADSEADEPGPVHASSVAAKVLLLVSRLHLLQSLTFFIP